MNSIQYLATNTWKMFEVEDNFIQFLLYLIEEFLKTALFQEGFHLILIALIILLADWAILQRLNELSFQNNVIFQEVKTKGILFSWVDNPLGWFKL